eukprot:3029752-Prymnesium_polylepis.1
MSSVNSRWGVPFHKPHVSFARDRDAASARPRPLLGSRPYGFTAVVHRTGSGSLQRKGMQ